jgi:hypothetical protein
MRIRCSQGNGYAVRWPLYFPSQRSATQVTLCPRSPRDRREATRCPKKQPDSKKPQTYTEQPRQPETSRRQRYADGVLEPLKEPEMVQADSGQNQYKYQRHLTLSVREAAFIRSLHDCPCRGGNHHSPCVHCFPLSLGDQDSLEDCPNRKQVGTVIRLKGVTLRLTGSVF